MVDMPSVHRPFDGSDRNNYFMRPETAGNLELVDIKNFYRYRATVKSWAAMPYEQKGFKYSISTDSSDVNLGRKKMAIHRAVDMIVTRGFKLPANTQFFCTNYPDVLNQAFHFDGGGKNVCWVTLGSTATTGGSGRGVSASPSPGFAPELKITLHELGHTLHAHNVGRLRFYSDPRLRAKNTTVGTKISGYASNNIAKEIIAEAFTGMMIGREYSNDVIQFYSINGGPRILQGGGREGFAMIN